MAGKSAIGLILVVGVVVAAGWCFMAGPCKGWLDQAANALGPSIGGVLNPAGISSFQQKLTAELNKDVADLTSKFGPVKTGASDGSIVSQSQMPTSSFTHSYMGHLSYW
jgi:hypothetical protein